MSAADGPGSGALLQEALRLILAMPSHEQRRHDQPRHEQADGLECRICPLCQGIAAVRQLRPEAVEHLAAALGELALAVREVLRPAGQPSGDPRDHGDPCDTPDTGTRTAAADAGGAAGSAEAARRPERVQRIPVTD